MIQLLISVVTKVNVPGQNYDCYMMILKNIKQDGVKSSYSGRGGGGGGGWTKTGFWFVREGAYLGLWCQIIALKESI